jgi:hypothetical protein
VEGWAWDRCSTCKNGQRAYIKRIMARADIVERRREMMEVGLLQAEDLIDLTTVAIRGGVHALRGKAMGKAQRNPREVACRYRCKDIFLMQPKGPVSMRVIKSGRKSRSIEKSCKYLCVCVCVSICASGRERDRER